MGWKVLNNSVLGQLLIKILDAYNTSLAEFEEAIGRKLSLMEAKEGENNFRGGGLLGDLKEDLEFPNEFMVSTPNKREEFLTSIMVEESLVEPKTEKKKVDNFDIQYLEAIKAKRKIMAFKGSEADEDLKRVYKDLRKHTTEYDIFKEENDFFEEHQEVIDSFRVSGDEFQSNHEENIKKYIENLKNAIKAHRKKETVDFCTQTTEQFVHISALQKLESNIKEYKEKVSTQQLEIKKSDTKKEETTFQIHKLEHEKTTLDRKLNDSQIMISALNLEKSTLMDKFIAIEKVMRMIKDHDLNGYKNLIIEVCKNSASHDRREFFSDKFKEEGKKYTDPYKTLTKRLKTDKEIIIITEKEKPPFKTQSCQTIDKVKLNTFTQTENIKSILKSKRGDRGSSSSRSKIVKKSSVIPQTYRGGGFLHYSRSIDTDEVVSPLMKPSYEDYQCLGQNPKANGQLIMNHPKMKGDNMIQLIKQSESFKRLPVKARRLPGNLKHLTSMKSSELRMEPLTLNSMFSKESFQVDDLEEIIDSGRSSSGSSNIQIDKYYTLDKDKESDIIVTEKQGKIVSSFKKEGFRPTTARAIILKNRKRIKKKNFHTKKRRLTKPRRH